MGPFWKEYPIVGPEWLFVCVLSSLLAIPIFYLFGVREANIWKVFGGFLFLNYVIGYFIVLVVFFGIGSNIIKLFDILPKTLQTRPHPQSRRSGAADFKALANPCFPKAQTN